MAFTIGYTNASWNAKADWYRSRLRVLNYMIRHGYDTWWPQHPGDSVNERPLMDFTPGYVPRRIGLCCQGGSVRAWVPWVFGRFLGFLWGALVGGRILGVIRALGLLLVYNVLWGELGLFGWSPRGPGVGGLGMVYCVKKE